MKEFKFSAIQATAILEMKLQRLAGLERKKIEDELKATQELIKSLKEILESSKRISGIIKDECKEIKEKYAKILYKQKIYLKLVKFFNIVFFKRN